MDYSKIVPPWLHMLACLHNLAFQQSQANAYPNPAAAHLKGFETFKVTQIGKYACGSVVAWCCESTESQLLVLTLAFCPEILYVMHREIHIAKMEMLESLHLLQQI